MSANNENTSTTDKRQQQRKKVIGDTGIDRAARPELIEIADTVTDMQNTKHAYKASVCTQKGIEL